ncbi:hypothetical protein [Demequina soli]|uniref:hypothetical protein n=1 Tax=Demequina soli TaxID=1638987 RepID=UPI0012E0BA0B|nr:hypothetical protein [Demequina soli]
MTGDPVNFYVRNRKQISEWAGLRVQTEKLMRDAVSKESPDTALKLMTGESGDADVDFYVRNRSLIEEWDALQGPAGLALHHALLEAATGVGARAHEGKRGWTTVSLPEAELGTLVAERHEPLVELVWTKSDLLSTRRGYAFPRMTLAFNPNTWTKDERLGARAATRKVAHSLGMRRIGDAWWAHWGVLPEINETQSLGDYAAACIDMLNEGSARLYPAVRDWFSELPS